MSVAIDDTRLRRTGRRIQTAFYQYDPLSPKFRGLRFLQISLLVPLYRDAKASPRGLPVRFEEVPAVKRPRRNADASSWNAYRLISKKQNLSQRAIELLAGLRQSLDHAGAHHKRLLVVGDNSFCNRPLFTAALERSAVIARARRDVKLCKRALMAHADSTIPLVLHPSRFVRMSPLSGRKRAFFMAVSGARCVTKRFATFTGEPVAVDNCYDCSSSLPFLIKFLAAAAKLSRSAYLLTTDLQGTPRELLQAYSDPWQIEVNHREEKDTLGVGQAQLPEGNSEPRRAPELPCLVRWRRQRG